MNLNSILIGSEDPRRLVEFYTRLFGPPVADESYSSWQLGSGSVAIGPHDAVKGRNVHPGRIIWNLETENVQAEFERMRAAGATVIAEPYSPGDTPGFWIATFADPDDNYFQLMSPMPTAG